MSTQRPDYYSVDASALIELDKTYPVTVFRGMWDFLGELANDGRLRVCEQAKAECKDEALIKWFAQHATATVEFNLMMAAYMNTLIPELEQHHLSLTDPQSVKNITDPFVIALALELEERDLAHLPTAIADGPRCHVIAYERRRGKGSKLAGIPNVCDFYGLPCIKWPELLFTEGIEMIRKG
ncbi:MAG: DUF4411 family protein [Armatimonadota bacterium]